MPVSVKHLASPHEKTSCTCNNEVYQYASVEHAKLTGYSRMPIDALNVDETYTDIQPTANIPPTSEFKNFDSTYIAEESITSVCWDLRYARSHAWESGNMLPVGHVVAAWRVRTCSSVFHNDFVINDAYYGRLLSCIAVIRRINGWCRCLTIYRTAEATWKPETA